ncbi:MAG: hypothetical protein SFX73_00420 [Kofleriaceae bacterium]|nr:hypothetical protein [Kofleriaceae bacterium]
MRAILLASCLVAAACGTTQRHTETLADTIRSYNDGVRWERFAVAAVAVPPAERADFVDEMDQRAKDLRISDYEVVKVDQKGEKLARVQVKMQWYLDSVGTLRETHALQTWERKGKTWWIVKEERLRGDEMPGLPEPPDGEGPTASAQDPATRRGGARTEGAETEDDGAKPR